MKDLKLYRVTDTGTKPYRTIQLYACSPKIAVQKYAKAILEIGTTATRKTDGIGRFIAYNGKGSYVYDITPS